MFEVIETIKIITTFKLNLGQHLIATFGAENNHFYKMVIVKVVVAFGSTMTNSLLHKITEEQQKFSSIIKCLSF